MAALGLGTASSNCSQPRSSHRWFKAFVTTPGRNSCSVQ